MHLILLLKLTLLSILPYSGNTADLRIELVCISSQRTLQRYADGKEWMNATILVVSPTETVEATNAGRASGDGFVLAEVKVKT